jgi:quercetin dioxygenase-like cupin family protein
MRSLCCALLVFPVVARAQVQDFGTCKLVAERTSDVGCWILADQSIGTASAKMYWHLDRYADSAHAARAQTSAGIMIHALKATWVMTVDSNKAPKNRKAAAHVTDIGPLLVRPGVEYSATFMEAITNPGMTSKVHRHSGPEAWYTVAGQTCLEVPGEKILGRPGKPAIVPQGPPMFLTATGKKQRRAITLILHETKLPPTTMENTWKPKGLCG